MAQRNETSQRKLSLLNDLREAQARGEGIHRTTPLSQRELSARYGLSGQTVSVLLQQLMQEGVLYTVPRVGTFLGRPQNETSGIYLFVTPVPRGNYVFVSHIEAMHSGFADRIAQLGAATHNLAIEEMLWHLEEGNLTNIAGLFLFDVPQPVALDVIERLGAPGVVYNGDQDAEGAQIPLDTVNFDDREGGVQATRHLLASGHRNIAFLGLHTLDQAGIFFWSVRREAGWSQALESAGLDSKNLSYLPQTTSSAAYSTQEAIAREIAAQMVEAIRSQAITAVVAVNVHAAQGLIQVLHESLIPRELWPAIVCFDDAPNSPKNGVSYLRLPWEKMGTEAAQLLWERKRLPESHEPRHRLVKMHLIPRLTCQPDWASSGLALTETIAPALTQAGAIP